jgi:hypothetical protein
MTYGEVYDEECRERPEIDFIPCEEDYTYASGYEISITDKALHSPYRRNDEYLDLKKIIPSHGSSYPYKRQEQHFSLSLNKGKKMNYRGAIERSRELGLSNEWETYVYPPYEALDYYCNPFNVIRVCDELGSEYKIRIPKNLCEEKIELLRSRDSIFGKLSPEKWVEIGSLRPSEIALMQYLHFRCGKDEGTYRFFLSIFRKYPGIGNVLYNKGCLTDNILAYIRHFKRRAQETEEEREYSASYYKQFASDEFELPFSKDDIDRKGKYFATIEVVESDSDFEDEGEENFVPIHKDFDYENIDEQETDDLLDNFRSLKFDQDLNEEDSDDDVSQSISEDDSEDIRDILKRTAMLHDMAAQEEEEAESANSDPDDEIEEDDYFDEDFFLDENFVDMDDLLNDFD